MVRRALSAVGWSLVDLWDNILVLAAANIIWALSLLPGVIIGSFVQGGVIVFILAFVVLTLLGGPATIGLFYMTSDASRRERIELNEFWRGVKLFYRRGWLLGCINSIFVLVAVFNLLFYSQKSFTDSPIRLMYIIWVYFIITWFIIQLYMWPLAIRMSAESRISIKLLLRNTALATFKYIGFSLILGLITLLMFVVEVVIVLVPLVIFGMSLYCLIGNRATKMILLREKEAAAISSSPDTQTLAVERTIDAPVDVVKAKTFKADQNSTEDDDKSGKTEKVNPPGVTRRGL